jgi:hypothetical protein
MRWLGSMPIWEPCLVRANIMTKPRRNENVAKIDLCNFHDAGEFGQGSVAQLERGESDALETLGIFVVPKRQAGAALRNKELRYGSAIGLEKQGVEPALGLGTQRDRRHAA